MPTLRITACLALVVALSGWRHTGLKKEILRVQVRSVSGSALRVRVHAEGLVIIPEHPTVARLPKTTDTIIVTPATLTFGGVGEAEIEAVAGAEVLVVAQPFRPNALASQRLRGKAFRVTHITYAEPFRVIPRGRDEPAQAPRAISPAPSSARELDEEGQEEHPTGRGVGVREALAVERVSGRIVSAASTSRANRHSAR